MTISHFVSRKTLVAADTKPSPQIAQHVILEELDTGNFYQSDGSSITIQNGPDKSEILQNKILPPEDNEFLLFNTPFDYPFLKNFEQKGHVIAAGSVSNSFHGLVEGSTLYNANNIMFDQSLGTLVTFQSNIDDEKIGFVSSIPIARRDKGYEIKTEFKSNAQTVLLGFSTANLFDPVNIFGASDKGVAIGWTLNSPWICAYNHDGSGGVVTTASAIGKGIGVHTFEIQLTTANIKCIVDEAQTLTLTTDIPGSTDNLYLLIYGIH